MLESLQTTLRLTNASGLPPHIRDFHALAFSFLSKNYIYRSGRTHGIATTADTLREAMFVAEPPNANAFTFSVIFDNLQMTYSEDFAIIGLKINNGEKGNASTKMIAKQIHN